MSGYLFGYPDAEWGPAELLSYSIFSVSVDQVRILSPRLEKELSFVDFSMIDSFLISEKLSIFEYPRKEEVFQSVIYIDFVDFHLSRQIFWLFSYLFVLFRLIPIFLDTFIFIRNKKSSRNRRRFLIFLSKALMLVYKRTGPAVEYAGHRPRFIFWRSVYRLVLARLFRESCTGYLNKHNSCIPMTL